MSAEYYLGTFSLQDDHGNQIGGSLCNKGAISEMKNFQFIFDTNRMRKLEYRLGFYSALVLSGVIWSFTNYGVYSRLTLKRSRYVYMLLFLIGSFKLFKNVIRLAWFHNFVMKRRSRPSLRLFGIWHNADPKHKIKLYTQFISCLQNWIRERDYGYFLLNNDKSDPDEKFLKLASYQVYTYIKIWDEEVPELEG